MITLNLYFQQSIILFKKNFMLFVMAFMLLIVTFFIWAGVPLFVVGSVVAQFTKNIVIVTLFVSLSGGFLFSLYFLPFNVKVAKNISNIKRSNVVAEVFYIEAIWVLLSTLVFATIISSIIAFQL